jgi:methylphosphotriester-DNA--protein-cysteine methyltransferase
VLVGRGRRYKPEQVAQILRDIEAAMAAGKTTGEACRNAGIVSETYHRWRNEYCELTADQVKRMKGLERENKKLRQLVADLSLEKLALKDIISANL